MANAGDISDLQVVVGDYQTARNSSHRRISAGVLQSGSTHSRQCTNCGLQHYIDTPCKGGDSCVKMPASEQALCVPIQHGQRHGGWHVQAADSSIPRWHWGTSQGQDWTRGSCSSCADHSRTGLDEKEAENAEQKESESSVQRTRRPRRLLRDKSSGPTAGEEEQAEDDPETPEQALPTATRSKCHDDPEASEAITIGARERTPRHYQCAHHQSSPSKRTCMCVHRQRNPGWQHRDGHGCTGHASHTGSSEGQRWCDNTSASLRASSCSEADEAAQLQDTMAAWRQRTGKAIASMVLSATMTMALTKVRIRQQRQQARARIEATMQMVHEVLRSGMEKDKLRQAYFRLAATYAMVEIRRVIRCLHNRNIEAQRDDAVQRYCSVVSAETIIAALMAGASARSAVEASWRGEDVDTSSLTVSHS